MRMIDLSQDIYEGMKVYPGHLKTVQFEHATHEETAPRFDGGFSFQTRFHAQRQRPDPRRLVLPPRPGPPAETIEKMSLDLFYGPRSAWTSPGSSRRPTSPPRTSTGSVARSRRRRRARATSCCSTPPTWNRFAGDQRYLSEFAGLGESASKWIVERGIKTFGVDSPTPDNPASTSYPCHMMCRREHITHYENLAHLDELLNKRFTFVGFPLKLVGAHGGPTRAVALVED